MEEWVEQADDEGGVVCRAGARHRYPRDYVVGSSQPGDEPSIKNDEFCIRNDKFCIQNIAF